MTAKELLVQWQYAIQEIAAIQHQIDKIKYPSTGGCKGVIINDMPRGTNDPTSATNQALDHYEAVLNEVKQEKAALLEETERMLKTVSDSLARIILRHYYGEGLKDSQISDVLRKARETITRRRTMAENYLQKTYVVSQNITDNHMSSVV